MSTDGPTIHPLKAEMQPWGGDLFHQLNLVVLHIKILLICLKFQMAWQKVSDMLCVKMLFICYANSTTLKRVTPF